MKKTIPSLALILCLALGLLSGCGSTDAASADTTQTAADAADAGAASIAADTTIVFSNGRPDVDGPGVEIDDDFEVDIQTGGVYLVSGASDTGRIVVEAAETDDVTIILAGCDLSYPDDEVIYFKTAASATVVLAAGTESILTSGAPSEAEADETEAEEDASGAVLRAKCDMTVTGTGSLTVYGYINNGIASTGDLAVESGTINVTAVNDALKARGDLTIEDGAIVLAAEQDGAQADGTLTVSGGALTVTTGVGAADADMKVSDSLMMGNFGGFGDRRASGEADETEADAENREPVEETPEPAELSDGDDADAASSGEMTRDRSFPMPGTGWDADDDASGSHKGLKSEGDIVITGGTLILDAEDDAIHAAGNVTIEDGTLVIRSGDDGIHADGALDIKGGSVTVTLCYEGLEATNILIEDGFVDLIAADDGMNVNGGDFGMMMRGRASGEASTETEDAEAEAETEAEEETPAELRITGGTVLVDSGGDGLDSNGSIYIEGGTIYVSGPSSNWDAAIDYGDGGYEFIITGGTLLAGGYSGMAESPDGTDASQCTIYYAAEEYCADGDTVTLLDADGNVLMEYSLAHGFNCVVLSSPDLVVGETYTLLMGEQTVEIELTETSWSNRSFGGMGGSREMGASREMTEDAAAE